MIVYYDKKNKESFKGLKTLRAKRYLEAWSYFIGYVSEQMQELEFWDVAFAIGISDGSSAFPIEKNHYAFIKQGGKIAVVFLNYKKLTQDFPILTHKNIKYADKHLMAMLFGFADAIRAAYGHDIYTIVKNILINGWSYLQRLKRVLVVVGDNRYEVLNGINIETPLVFDQKQEVTIVEYRVKTKNRNPNRVAWD